ncbi:MAG: hypothetical protein ABI652_00170 [Acidobacteriota bacterium]|jgi:hypothetical protein
MTRINYVRVLLGGLVAGVVANVCDVITNMVLMTTDMQLMLQRLGRDVNVMNQPATAITWAIIDFIYATVIVFTYAAIRPRFGPGPKTAMTAGLITFVPVAVVLFGFFAMDIFSPQVYFKNTALSLVTTMLASLAGGAVYKES